MCKTKWFLVVTMAAVMMMAGQVNAEGIISVNFSENDGNQAFAGGELIGPLATDSANWNNTTGDRDSGDLVSGGISNLKDDSGALTGAGVTWQSSNVWWNNDATGDDEHKMAVGYLDDGDSGAGNGVEIEITGIPYNSYRVYGLLTSDQTPGPVYTTMNVDVNGTWVLGGDATTTAEAYWSVNDNNTNNGEFWTEIEPGVIGNYWTIETSGATCTITGQIRVPGGTERCSITAVIIERTAVAGLLAGNPDPPDDPDLTGAEVPTNKTMGWDIAEDPNDGNYGVGPDPSIAGHHIYLTTDKAALEAIDAGVTTDPNIYRGFNLRNDTTYTPGVFNAGTNPGGLDTDKVYHWRIDERAEYISGDPNTWKGGIWTFQTTKLLPVFNPGGQPQDTSEFLGDPAELSVSVTSATTESYQWKKVDPPGDVGTNSPTLSFASATVGDEGQYYCVITNNAGPVTSDTAWLDVKRLVGRWQLNNDLTDSAGGRTGLIDPGIGYGGMPPADPNFNNDGIEDINGGDGQSYEFYADVTEHIRIPGTDTDQFNFHKRSGVTASAWVKTTQAGWGAPLNRSIRDRPSSADWIGWVLNKNPNGVMTVREGPSDVVGTTAVNDGEWHLLTGTYDPATGVTQIYVDGVLENDATVNDPIPVLSSVFEPIIIGAEDVTGNFPYEGLVDDARVYNYVLSPFEIAYLFTSIMQDEMICAVPITYDLDATGTSYCIEDLLDFAAFALTWLECNKVGYEGCYTPVQPID